MPDTTDQKARGLLLQMVFGFFPSAAIHAAAELRLPDVLGEGVKSAEELADATGAHRPSLYRLCRALAYLGILAEVDEGRFELTGLGTLLRSDVPGSVWATSLLFGGEAVWRSWGELPTTVRTGEQARRRIFGTEAFDPDAEGSESSRLFNQAMSEGTRQMAPGLIESYDFGQFGTIVDVGGGDGTLLAAILEATPNLRGVLLDTPSGLAEAGQRLEEAGVAERCEIVAGDFFEAVPEGADAYLMKSVIHDWDDESCVRILRNCRRAMAGGAKVLILEGVMPAKVEPSFSTLGMIMSDLNMLVCTDGRERTEAEFASLLDAAGLALTTVVSTPPPSAYSLIEAVAG